jgi:hypothetical protein
MTPTFVIWETPMGRNIFDVEAGEFEAFLAEILGVLAEPPPSIYSCCQRTILPEPKMRLCVFEPPLHHILQYRLLFEFFPGSCHLPIGISSGSAGAFSDA